MSDCLVPDSDNAIWLDNLFDQVDEELVIAGTVTFELKDSAGAAVSGGTGSLSYVGGPMNSWVGVLEDNVSLTPGASYTVIVTVAASGDRVRRFDRVVQAARSAT